MTTPDDPLSDLLRRVRANDPGAAAELLRRYEPDIRRIARVRLARFDLRHLVDSEDIAQSVFGRFFARLRYGEWEFDSGEKVLHLLAVIAANRVTSHARRERRRVRPTGRAAGESAVGLEAVPDHRPGVGPAVAARDHLDWLLAAVGPDDRELLAGRLAGRGWAELAADRGVGADAVRKRLARALDEVAGRLGID